MVKQHDFAARRQMRNVALEVPLAPLAFGRGGQRHSADDARVEALHDPFDRPALPRRISSLENDDELELLGLDPVLELDELALQTQELLEIKAARQGIVRFKMFGIRQEVGELFVLELQLDVLVEILLNLRVDTLLKLADRTLLIRAHCWHPLVGASATTNGGDQGQMFDSRYDR